MSQSQSTSSAGPGPDDAGGGGDVVVRESNNNSSPSPTVIIGEPTDNNYNPFESVLWTHNWFRKSVNPQQGICLLCEDENSKLPVNAKKKKFAFSATNWSTSGCRTHLITKHQGPNCQKFLEQESRNDQVRAQMSADKKEKKSSDGMKQPQLLSMGGFMKMEAIHDPLMQNRFDIACVDFCAETFTSFNAMESINIILEAIGRDKKVKARSKPTLIKNMVKRADNMRQDIYNIIASFATKPGGVSLTSDAWTNKSLDSFLSLTVHYINDNMEMVTFVPFVQFMEKERHTGENLLIRTERFLEKLGLTKNEVVKYLTLDNASNNKKCARLSNKNNKMFVAQWCGNHTLALSVSDFFKLVIKYSQNVVIKDILRKCQEVAIFVRKSEKTKVALENACKDTNVSFRLPILANKTRWNSRYDNIESNLELKKPLLHLSNNDTSKDQKWRKKVLSPVEYEAAESINKALACIKIASKLWESETSPTLHLVVRELYNIRGVLRKLSNDENESVSEFAAGLLEQVEKRYKNCGTKNKFYCMGNLLDPRYQGVILEEFSGRYEAAKKEVIKLCSKYDPVITQTDASGDATSNANTNNDDDDDDLSEAEKLRKRRRISGDRSAPAQAPEPVVTRAERELRDYLQLQIGDEESEDLLKFWFRNKERFPLLCKVVQELFCLQVSSSSSERAFSVGGSICSQKRRRFNPETVERLSLIKLNRKKLQEYEAKYGIPKPIIPVTPSDTDFDIEEDLELLLSNTDNIQDELFYDDLDYFDDEDTSTNGQDNTVVLD